MRDSKRSPAVTSKQSLSLRESLGFELLLPATTQRRHSARFPTACKRFSGTSLLPEATSWFPNNAATLCCRAQHLATPTPIRANSEHDELLEFRAALEEVMMSQTDFASLLKVERSTVWRWFSGEREVPHYAMVILSALAGGSPTELRSGRLRQFNVQRHHVYLKGETFRDLAKRLAP